MPADPHAAHSGIRVLPGEAPLDWERIYRDNVVFIYRLLYSRVGNREDAEDLTSQVFLAALPRLRADTSSGAAHNYLVNTARTVLADHWRQRLVPHLTVIDENVEVVSHTQEVGPDPLPRIRRLLATLPPNYRRILELRFLEQCSIREAAAAMGVSVGNARVLQHRALQRAAELGKGEDAL